MKTRITDECIACEQCVEICPEVFQMGEEFAEVIVNEIPEELEEDVQEAAEICPTEAIVID